MPILRGVQSAETAELVEKLEDSQMSLGSMASSRYSAPFFEEVNAWMVKLSLVSEQVPPGLLLLCSIHAISFPLVSFFPF